MEKTNKPQTPYLLRIPLNQEGSNAQPSTFKSPKLLKVVLPGYRDKIGKPKELFRLPLSELPLNYSNQNQRNASKEGVTDRNSWETNRKAPKLINLKKIFQNSETMHLPYYPSDKNIQREINEVPQLIRLPDLNQKTNKDDKFKRSDESKSAQGRESQLAQVINNLPEVPLKATPLQMLESPKRSTQSVNNTKQPTIPKIIDIRPNTPQQETRLVQMTDTRENNPPKLFAKNTQRTTVFSPAVQDKESKSRARRRRRNKKDGIISEEDVYCKNEHDKENKVDDEIYDIIYELILEKKKRKKRQQKRKLKLFDIIDNLPITSESEESPLVNKAQQKSKVNLSNIPSVGLSFRPSNVISKENGNQNKHPYQSAIGEPIEQRPNFLKQVANYTGDMLHFDSGIPDPPKLNSNVNSKQSIEKENSSLDQYKPIMPKFLHPDKVKDDPLSWKNILKLTRNDSKHTQTETYKTKTHETEVQTEIQEMVEIPKTQTFFTEPDIKQTNEFCERVRSEIIEKLDINKKVLENKGCQTVSDAKTQTKPSNSPGRIDSEEHFLEEEQNIQMKRNEKEGEQIIEIEPKLDPNLMNQLYFNVDENLNKQFLDVIDIEADDKLSVNNEDQVTRKHAVNENKSKVTVPEDVIQSFENTNAVTREDEDDFTQDFHENNIVNSDVDEQDKRQPNVTRGYETSSPRVDKSFGVSYKRTDTSKQPKELLEDNIKNFSFGLKALEEIQENIERELKHSKFLFNTIESLQKGFDADDNPIQTVHNKKVSSTKYSIYENRDEGNLTSQNKLYRENLISSKNLLSDRKSVDEENDAMSVAKGEIEDDFSTKDSFHSNKDTRANDSSDNILADSLDVVHNFDDANNVVTEQLSSDGEKGQADGLSFISISNDNRSFDPNATSSFVIHTDDFRDMNQIDDEEKKKKEELFKESIRRKLRPPPEEDPAAKKKKEKRAKLLDWMKRKQKERSKKYLQQLEVKREKEFRPFVTKNNVSTFEIGQDKVLKAETKRILLEENNEERIHLAEKLANEIISSARKTKVRQKENLSPSKRQGYNTRYQSSKSASAIPVRETRSSKIRKTALLKEIIKNTSNAEYADRKRRRKPENRKPKKTQKSSKNALSTYQVKSNNMLNTDISNISKISVDPGNFVTLVSYLNYQPKSNDVLLSESMQQYTLHKSMDTLDSANILQSLSGTVRGQVRSNMALYSSAKTNDSVDTSKVCTILKNYEYNVDEEIFGRKSETSRLLAEVDMFLMDDDEAAFSQTSPIATNESIDWNEIENILNES